MDLPAREEDSAAICASLPNYISRGRQFTFITVNEALAKSYRTGSFEGDYERRCDRETLHVNLEVKSEIQALYVV